MRACVHRYAPWATKNNFRRNNIMETVIGILLLIMAVFLVVAVLMQSSKDHRLSGTIAGGAETFFGKQKGKSIDALLSKITTIVAIVFVILVLVLYFMQAKPAKTNDNTADDTNPGVEDVVTPDKNGDTTADDTTADDTNAADDASTADDTNADNADAAADDAENADAPVEENTEADGADATVAE